MVFPMHNLKRLFSKPILIWGTAIMLLACIKSYIQEEVDQLFAAITQKYGVKIVCKIDKDFPPILVGGYNGHLIKSKESKDKFSGAIQ
jgi:hypothetical protein